MLCIPYPIITAIAKITISLVKGANWYDERFGQKPRSEKNDAGIHAKRYLDPAARHSTVGFRYVVSVKLTE